MQAMEAVLGTNVPVGPKALVSEANSSMGLAILRAISDEPSNMIMRSAVSKGKSVEEICLETGVPLSTAYRKIGEMMASGLIFVERVELTEAGKKHLVYRTAYSKVAIQCDPVNFTVESTPNAGVPDIVYRLWLFASNHPER
ncbi:MAG TPA: hypothetical protein VLU91_07590 [Nitrososphaerales archaeon]|nr:hypothetical protein [Nitrososphaerales archaeon]